MSDKGDQVRVSWHDGREGRWHELERNGVLDAGLAGEIAEIARQAARETALAVFRDEFEREFERLVGREYRAVVERLIGPSNDGDTAPRRATMPHLRDALPKNGDMAALPAHER